MRYEPWKWYQFLYDIYYRTFPDFEDRRFIIMEMIKVSMAFEEYSHAIGYMVNMLSYLTQYYIEQKRRIDEEDRSWYDKNEAEKYKRMVLEREINVIDLALPVYDYIDLEKILGRDETLEMFQKEVHRHGDKLKQNGFVEKFLKKVDETRKKYKN